MAEILLKRPSEIRSSSGVVRDYSITAKSLRSISNRRFQKEVILEMVRNDAILAAGVDATVDVTTYNGYDFVGDDKAEIERARKMFDDELDFDQVLDPLIYSMILFGDPALEIKSNPSEIHLLEPLYTEPKYTENGEIIAFVLNAPNGAVFREFSPENIVYMPIKRMDTKVEGYYPLEPLINVFNSRLFWHHHVQEGFRNTAPKNIWGLEGAGKEQKLSFEDNLDKCKLNPHLDVVAQNKITREEILLKYDASLVSLYPMFRSEMLALLRVPPIFIGIPDNSNRSNSEVQLISFESKIRKMQQKIESHFNRQLMPKLGFKKTKFKFNKITFRDDKTLSEIAVLLKSVGVSGDGLKSYLADRGFKIPEDFKVNDPLEMQREFAGNPGNLGQNNANERGFPSRLRQNKGTDSMKTSIERGGSVDGKKKLSTTATA